MSAWTGASVVVTGGASGLGLATVIRFAAMGARVTVADLDSTEARDRVTAVRGDVEFVATDVTDAGGPAGAMAAAGSRGPLRAVVACAGIGQYRRILHHRAPLGLADFTQVIEVNLVGAAATLIAAAEEMAGNEPVDGDRGVIVLTSSVAAHGGGIGSFSYCTAKAGVSGMTLPAAHDLAERGIRVVGIEPGFFDTPLLSAQASSFQALADATPHPRRFGRPEEFARLVAEIADNRMLNGVNIRLDGAWRSSYRAASGAAGGGQRP